jgi:hypothetical protein
LQNVWYGNTGKRYELVIHKLQLRSTLRWWLASENNNSPMFNKPFKTHVHKGETSVPSRPSFDVLMNAVTLITLWSMFSECVVNVSERFVNVSDRFVNVFRTFGERFWPLPFCQRLVNVSDRYRFVNVFRTFLTVLSTFSKRFVNISELLETFYVL